jgi:hypothetical protein
VTLTLCLGLVVPKLVIDRFAPLWEGDRKS